MRERFSEPGTMRDIPRKRTSIVAIASEGGLPIDEKGVLKDVAEGGRENMTRVKISRKNNKKGIIKKRKGRWIF